MSAISPCADKKAYEKMAQFCWDLEIVTYGPSEKPEEKFAAIRKFLKSAAGQLLEALKTIGKVFRRDGKK